MITVDLANTIFIGCVLVGGGLLLVTVLLDDILGGILDSLHIGLDLGGVSLMPLLLGFVSMFGVGGLIGTQVLNLGTGAAAIVGVISGFLGSGLVYVLFSFLRRAQGPEAFSLQELVGETGRITVGIPEGRSGTVLLSHAGQTHELTATAEEALAAGSIVTVTAIAGSLLVVTRAASRSPATTTQGGVDA